MPNAKYRIGAPYHAVARHPEEKPYNKMHEDGLPQQLGFRDAEHKGAALYGYMTRALVASLGEAWLGRAVIDVRFLRPVCPGDRIRMETTAVPGEGGHAFEVAMHNETSGNELSATLKTSNKAASKKANGFCCVNWKSASASRNRSVPLSPCAPTRTSSNLPPTSLLTRIHPKSLC